MPETLRLRATHAADIQHAADILRSGGLVAFPTETVYGLGANAFSSKAVAKIFVAKQRPAWDPLIVHIADALKLADVAQLQGDVAARVHTLSNAFWPGPLTLLLPRSDAVPDEVTAGRPLVGVRWPSHPVAQALLRVAGIPIAAPSANRFGHVSPTTAQHVLDDLDGRIDAVLDGGATTVGVESTVLDPTGTPMVLYRTGAITLAMLQEAGYEAKVFQPAETSGNPIALPSPGVGMRHYAPEAELLLAGSDAMKLQQAIQAALHKGIGQVGVLLPRDWTLDTTGSILEPWGRWDDPEAQAAELFAGLRRLEMAGVAVIVCPLPEPGGMRDALRDRLQKAAKPR